MAAKTSATAPTWPGLQPFTPISPNNTATATHPANQKRQVRTSTPRTAYLCAASGYRLGNMVRYAVARIVQAETNNRKLTSAGDGPGQ
jgi:hypothetical protein